MAEPIPETAPAERICFFVTPIGDENSPQRVRANDVMDYIVTPALSECGYKTPPLRADQMPHPGQITRQIIDQLINADLVIADLSDHNPNVFYELAIRHAVRKPVVQIIHIKDKIPFDVANQRTIFYNHQDLRSADDARKAIVVQIKAAEADPGNVDTPLTEAILVTSLSQSTDPVARSNGEIMSALQSMQAELIYLRRSMDVKHYDNQPISNDPFVTSRQYSHALLAERLATAEKYPTGASVFPTSVLSDIIAKAIENANAQQNKQSEKTDVPPDEQP